MGKCVIVNLIDYSERLNNMKCPFCGVKMKKIVQHYEGYDIPDLVQYDHPATKCEHGVIEFRGRLMGHTKTEQGWIEYHKQITGQ